MIKLNALADVADFHEVGPAVTVEEWCEKAQEAMKDDERLQRFLKAREVEEKLEVSEGEQKMQVEEELAVPVDGEWSQVKEKASPPDGEGIIPVEEKPTDPIREEKLAGDEKMAVRIEEVKSSVEENPAISVDIRGLEMNGRDRENRSQIDMTASRV